MTRIVVSGGTVFDGTGAAPARADIAIEGDRIAEVGVGLDGDGVIDATGMTVLPGLFDCHVHVCSSGLDLVTRLERPFSYQFYAAARNMAAMLDLGITSARDANGADLGMKRAQEEGLLDGPRLSIAVTLISQTGGHGDGWRPSGCTMKYTIAHPGRPDGIADGPDAIRHKAREIIRAGADVIKVCTTGGVLSSRDHPHDTQFQPDELAVLDAAARAAHKPWMAHAQSPEGIKNAVRAGARSIEHGIYLDDECLELMVEHGTWLVPTLVATKTILDMADSGVRLSPAAVAKAREAFEAHQESFARAVQAGVKIAMGTDTGVGPFGSNLDELPLMLAGGMTPAQVLHATTGSAADLLGFGDLGRLTPGRLADLVLVEGDGLEVTGLAGRVRLVMMNGEIRRG
ncbi:amidohydrolase family protein [Spongiactinospora gelatinilytica]|uniref:Amidohydrolase family protein n=1 Tax=Spongiactinospora gelatinilytica TaxID=2666298 RepID=A0A2W2G3W4_9ACTN|nr:amidohydrolase family protein [Spongiactinospora gelatinilytica]PZG37119.1 amidohydrolase family protein [Spongiactinospora gelatinilytica]